MSELEDEIERLKSELEKARGHAAHLADALDWVERESGWVPNDTPLPVYIGEMRKERDIAVRALLEFLHKMTNPTPSQISIALEDLRHAIDPYRMKELHTLREERDAALKCCAEMREALIPFQCETCNGTHKFKFECPGCLSGEAECTCDKQSEEPCPQCQSCDDIKKIYGDLEHALSTDCGKGYVKVEAAEKACAELREAIESLWPHCDLKAFGGSKPNWLIHALSNECGKDYVSRDEVKPLVEALEKIAERARITSCAEWAKDALAHWRKEEK